MPKTPPVIAQAPNPPLITWFISMLLARIITAGHWHLLFDWLAFGALFTWAWLEIFSGSSNFRRVAGLIVMLVILYTRVY